MLQPKHNHLVNPWGGAGGEVSRLAPAFYCLTASRILLTCFGNTMLSGSTCCSGRRCMGPFHSCVQNRVRISSSSARDCFMGARDVSEVLLGVRMRNPEGIWSSGGQSLCIGWSGEACAPGKCWPFPGDAKEEKILPQGREGESSLFNFLKDGL